MQVPGFLVVSSVLRVRQAAMQFPGFLVAVLVLGGLLWTSYFHTLWYGDRLELTGGYSCTEQVRLQSSSAQL